LSRLTLQTDRLRLHVLPALGAGWSDLCLRGPGGMWFPLLRRAPAQPEHFDDLACYLLAPWSNRIAGARFLFANRTIELEPNWPDGTAIHGLVNALPWTLCDRAPTACTLSCEHSPRPGGWPWAFACRARYEVGDALVRADLAVTNLDARPMPAGLGIHPLFNRVLWDVADTIRLTAPVAGQYPAQGMLPTGPARPTPDSRAITNGTPVRDLDLDDVFAGYAGRAELTWDRSGVRVAIESSPECGHLVVYAPPGPGRGGLPWCCVEPVTMVNDGFNLLARGEASTGVRVLEPGQTLAARWTLRVLDAAPGAPA
jgi:aldose 1-epimerase